MKEPNKESFLPSDIESTEIIVVGLLEGEDGLYYPVSTKLDLSQLKESQIALGKAGPYGLSLEKCEGALLGAKFTKDNGLD